MLYSSDCVLGMLCGEVHNASTCILSIHLRRFEDVMKYTSSTLLFAEYIYQKDKTDGTNQNDLIKTTLEFLITNEFIALVHVKEEEIADVLTKGII